MHFDAFISSLLFNILVAFVLVFYDFFGFLGYAKDRKRCTNREWRQGTKGFRNTVTWVEIRKFVPKYLFVFHIITLTVIAIGLLSPFPLLFGVVNVTGYASLAMMLWLAFCWSFSILLSRWENVNSSESSLLTSIFLIIAMIVPIAVIAICVYELLMLLGEGSIFEYLYNSVKSQA